MTKLNALPTEPLLDETAHELSHWDAPPEVRRWLIDLATERDPDLRANALYLGIRKQLEQPILIDMLRGMVVAAVRNEYEGAAALNAFLGVRASGDLLVTRVRAFSSLRRMRQRLRHRHDRDLDRREKAWLADLDRLLGRLVDEGRVALDNSSDGAAIAAELDRLFTGFLLRSEAEGRLPAAELELLRDMSRLELAALEARAAALAGSVNPYAAHHVERTIPMLAEIDADVRNLGEFLDRVDQGSPELLQEHVTVMEAILDEKEERRLRRVLEDTPELNLVWRLLLGLDRNPMPQRTLAWFADRVLVAGEILRQHGLRRRPMDVAACALTVLTHYRDGFVQVPASARVIEALRETGVEHVEFPDGDLLMVMDRERARSMPLPHGLPLPKLPLVNVERFAREREAEVSVKDLVMGNINNVSVMMGLLKNQKVISTPGIVAIIAQRARSMVLMDMICNTRSLHSGFANKDVPLAILKSPMNIPIKMLRRFVSVRFVSKVELKRLEVDRSAVRREVADEIRAYLKSLH